MGETPPESPSFPCRQVRDLGSTTTDRVEVGRVRRWTRSESDFRSLRSDNHSPQTPVVPFARVVTLQKFGSRTYGGEGVVRVRTDPGLGFT